MYCSSNKKLCLPPYKTAVPISFRVNLLGLKSTQHDYTVLFVKASLTLAFLKQNEVKLKNKFSETSSKPEVKIRNNIYKI